MLYLFGAFCITRIFPPLASIVLARNTIGQQIFLLIAYTFGVGKFIINFQVILHFTEDFFGLSSWLLNHITLVILCFNG